MLPTIRAITSLVRERRKEKETEMQAIRIIFYFGKRLSDMS